MLYSTHFKKKKSNKVIPTPHKVLYAHGSRSEFMKTWEESLGIVFTLLHAVSLSSYMGLCTSNKAQGKV